MAPLFFEMIIVAIIFVFFLGFAVDLGMHFPLARELRKAFDVAVERMHAANCRLAVAEKKLRDIEGAVQRSRGHRYNDFGGSVALPIAAENNGAAKR